MSEPRLANARAAAAIKEAGRRYRDQQRSATRHELRSLEHAYRQIVEGSESSVKDPGLAVPKRED